VIQYKWIDQVSRAERERSKNILSAALSDLECDFDIEITRAVTAFEFPAANSGEYAERYREWLRRSPYPDVIRGVYIFETGKSGALPKEAIPGEPAIRSTDWERDLKKLEWPLGTATAVRSAAPRASQKLVSRGGFAGFWGLSGPRLIVDGNPAFAFPIMPRAPGLPTQMVTHLSGTAPIIASISVGEAPPSQWVVVVLDANYLKATFLPGLLKARFANGLASDYDILVVDKMRSGPERILFRSPLAPPEDKFIHPDGTISLFVLRPDCFLPSAATNVGIANTSVLQSGPKVSTSSIYAKDRAIVGQTPELRAFTAGDSLLEILSRRPSSCVTPPPVLTGDSIGSWDLLARYRTGSLDQAMVTFRRRNLLLSISVLFILAIGICMLVVLAERARSLAEMQSEFVLGMSHELRTPLTIIRLAADNLKKGMVRNAEDAQKYGEIINTRASELTTMIEEALVFARMQSGSFIGKRIPVSPEEIVKMSLASCGAALHNAGIEVELHVAPELPRVEADIRMVDRCLQNLIQNVVKYAAAGRWVGIRVGKVILLEGERVQISVEDRGPGIPPSDLPHIFEPFYRGKGDEASNVPGVGLGLTLVKRLVEAHMGKLEVRSSDQGALFSILLRPHLEPKTREAV